MPSYVDTPTRPFLRSNVWLEELEDEVIDQLAGRVRHARYEDGETIFRSGGASTGLLIQTQGRIRITIDGRGGNETLLALVEPGDMIGEVGAIDGRPRTTNAIADGESHLITIPRKELLGILSTHPATAMKLARKLCVHVRTNVTRIDHFALHDAGARLLCRLLVLGQRYGEVDPSSGLIRIHHRLSQEDLARGSGLTRVSVNRLLGLWRREALVRTGRGWIEIPDFEALVTFVWETAARSSPTAEYTTSPEVIAAVRGDESYSRHRIVRRERSVRIDPNEILIRLRASELLKDLDEEGLARLAASARCSRFDHGESIYVRLSRFEGFPLLLDGRVKHATIGPSGAEILLSYSEPGTFFGEIGAIDGGRRRTHAIAEGGATIATIPMADMNEAIARSPAIAMKLLFRCCEWIRLGTATVAGLAEQDAGVRLLSRLLAFAPERETGADRSPGEPRPLRIHHGFSQQELADSTGLTRVSVNRQLAAWRSQGLVSTGRGTLEIPDLDALETFVWKR